LEKMMIIWRQKTRWRGMGRGRARARAKVAAQETGCTCPRVKKETVSRVQDTIDMLLIES
jgi:hypothetical protein